MESAGSTMKQMARESLVYVRSVDGHQQSYLDILGSIFNLEPVTGMMDAALFGRLVGADRLLFATLDESIFSFPPIAAIRSMLGRPTAALFLRPHKCFETGRWYYPLKRHAFHLLRRLPHLTIATITPFDVAPHYAEVAHVGVADAQYWDLCDDNRLPSTGSTSLSQSVTAMSTGRRILCLVGDLSLEKGLAFLADTLERHPLIADRFLVVGAGRVRPQAVALATRLQTSGALVVDRRITDAELASLYGIADLIWSCYTPDYDQASGIFGRAIQYGVTPIVREGSVIATFSTINGVEHIPVAYGAHEALAEMLLQSTSRHATVSASFKVERQKLIIAWRNQFVKAIGKGLAGERTAA